MSNIKPLDNKVLIEKYDKVRKKKSENFPFAVPETNSNVGVVVVSGNSSIPVGSKVLFGSKRETINFQGKELLGMEVSNIWGIIEEE